MNQIKLAKFLEQVLIEPSFQDGYVDALDSLPANEVKDFAEQTDASILFINLHLNLHLNTNHPLFGMKKYNKVFSD